MNKLKHLPPFSSVSVILAIVAVIFIGLDLYHYFSLSSRLDVLDKKLADTSAELSANITRSHTTLSEQLSQEKNSVGSIQQTLGSYTQQVSTVSSTVSTLEKLSKTDPQLLSKYSKVFFLSENYAPERLAQIPDLYSYSDLKTLKFHALAWPFLQRLLDDAKRSNVNVYVDSAYRSFTEQQALKGGYKVTYGAGTANQFSADQGYSEHQLGTTLDFISPGMGGNLDGFDNTPAYTWLTANAYKYGFILSYPKDNKFYIFEPWHWRFVGVKLATYLHQQNKNFYDMDQRDIDTYLVSIFD